MNEPWQHLTDEIARWNDAGRVVDFWWRDDDAGEPTEAFNRLATLTAQSRAPLALAVIPSRARPELFSALSAGIAVLQHGVDHRNRAPAAEKPCEFPVTETCSDALERIGKGKERLSRLGAERFLPVFVPPWNRFPAALLEHLPKHGIRGFSGFAPRTRSIPASGLRQVNAHVDIIAWKRGRTFVGEERALREAISHLAGRRTGTVDAGEPTGWLTHHERHDEAAWTFLARLFERTLEHPGVRWLHPRDVFAGGEEG